MGMILIYYISLLHIQSYITVPCSTRCTRNCCATPPKAKMDLHEPGLHQVHCSGKLHHTKMKLKLVERVCGPQSVQWSELERQL